MAKSHQMDNQNRRDCGHAVPEENLHKTRLDYTLYSPQIGDVLAALRHLPPFDNLIEPVGFVLKTLAKDRLEEHRMFNAWQDWAISCRSFDLGNSRAVWRGMGGGIKK